MEHVTQRLEMGELRYGHAGFEYTPHRLIHEAREEIWDAVAYLFMLHQRLNSLEQTVSRAESKHERQE